MRKLSDAFKRKQNEGTAKFLKYADFTLKDGTELHLSNEALWDNGFKFEDAVSSESSFDIGAAITNQCTISLNNIYDDFTDYVFEGAEVVCYVGLKLYPEGAKEDTIEQEWKDVDGNAILDVDGNKILLSRDDSLIERVRICTMTVTDAPYQNSSVINLVCQDNMRKFDRSYSDSKLQYPATRSEIIRDACNVCGVVLNTTTFENDDYVIKERPIDEGLTFRQVIAWTVQCGCQWLRCNEDGQLCIGWYNTEPKAEERGSVVNTNGLTVNMEDVVITGIRVTENVETSDDKKIKSYLCGEEGYVLEITGNKLICAGSGNEIATLIGERCIGMKFRPFTVKQLTDISLEAGDAVVVTDRKGNQYESYITNMNIQPGNYQLTECNAKSAERNSSKRYELLTQAMANARKNMNKKIARYDETVQQMTKLISQGFGMYFTEVKQENGGSIFYMHDKPNMEESGYVCYWTSNGIIASLDGGATWGIDKNGNALFNVITARGINAKWINTGEFRVVDEDGNEVFYVNCDTGVVRIKAQQFSLTGESIAEIANKQIDNFVENIYKTDLDEIKKQLSNKIETWYQDTDPSVNWDKITEVVWCDVDGYPILDADENKILTYYEELKAEHEGDLWYNTDTKEKWMYKLGQWVPEEIPDIVFDEIDGKSSIYINTPTTPYKERDLWFKDGKILVCKESRSTGECNNDDWVKKDEYTDDSKVIDFIENTYTPKIQEMQEQIDGKVESFFFDYEPTLENYPANKWTTEEERLKHNADTFYWKTKKSTYIFCKIDGVWQWLENKDPDIKKAMEAAEAAKDTADGKRRTFVTTPVPPYDEGDLWTQGDKGDLMCCKVSRLSGNYVSSDWGKATKYTDNSALDKFNEELNQSEIFNRLTNNGTEQGIFLKDGKIYINFSYAEGGTLKLGGRDNQYGELIMLDADGKEVGRWNNGELSTSSAKILGGTINIDTGGLNNAIKLNSRNNSLSLSPTKMVIKMDPINSGEYGYGNYSEIESNTIKMGRISNGSGNSAISNYTVLSPDGIVINDYKKGGHIYLEPISLGGYFDCDLTVTKNFSVQGTKNRIVNTENYASRLQYCYEMPSPMFGDIGEGYTDDTGVCVVAVDDIFRETVTSGSNYYVFLQKEGPGDIWIENKTDSYFTVQGTKNMKFSWEIKAKQKGYEFERLESYEESEKEESINYEDIGYNTYIEYVNALESLEGEEI